MHKQQQHRGQRFVGAAHEVLDVNRANKNYDSSNYNSGLNSGEVSPIAANTRSQAAAAASSGARKTPNRANRRLIDN